jgi:mRNA-degrading endonuclease RelE of RelBE toxin-antitoxin system
MKISASEQVQSWLVALPPDAKKRVRHALRILEKGKGDICALRNELAGFNRLRIGGMRVVYSQHPGRILRLEYADARDVVYENFLKVLARRRSK